jgi:hypothetical protein
VLREPEAVAVHRPVGPVGPHPEPVSAVRDVAQERDPALLLAVARAVERERWRGRIEQHVAEPQAVLAGFDEPHLPRGRKPGTRAKAAIVHERPAVLADDRAGVDARPGGETPARRAGVAMPGMVATQVAVARGGARLSPSDQPRNGKQCRCRESEG